jgi:hypothetical protein
LDGEAEHLHIFEVNEAMFLLKGTADPLLVVFRPTLERVLRGRLAGTAITFIQCRLAQLGVVGE